MKILVYKNYRINLPMIFLRIKYTGIGDYRQDHIYSPQEFIVLINLFKSHFRLYPGDSPMPVLNPQSFAWTDLNALVDWVGAYIATNLYID